MKSAIRIPIFGLALALGLAGCGAGGTASDTAAPTQSEIKIPPVWSLTGKPGPDDAQAKPIMVVKVENAPQVRPQTGLENADLIFEELVEGGMTRFATVFQSDIPAEIGPVRSVRHVDVAIAEPMADIFVFSGGAKRTMRFVNRKLPTTISVNTEGAPGLYRKDGHRAPHNLFLNPEELLASVADNASVSGGFFVRPESRNAPSPIPSVSSTASEPVQTAVPVSEVGVAFSTFAEPNWKWDSALSQWMRSEGIKPFKNKDGSQFGTDNLVIIEVREIDAGYKGSTGGYVPRTVLTGSGRAWVLSNGTAFEVNWNKPRVNAQMALTDLAGNPFTMPVGRTWVELIPILTTGHYSFDGVDVPMKKPPIPATIPDPSESATP